MPVHVHDHALPGVGRRYELTGADGDHVVVVVHGSGRRDLHLRRAGDDDAAATAVLTEREADALAAILAEGRP